MKRHRMYFGRVALATCVLVVTGFVYAQPASAASSLIVLADGKTFLANVTNGQVVWVSAPPGAFTPGSSSNLFLCNSDPAIPGPDRCDMDGSQDQIVGADGSVFAMAITYKTGQIGSDPRAVCPPSAAQVKIGIFCAMAIAALHGEDWEVGAAPMFPRIDISVTNNGDGTATVTCSNVANLTKAPEPLVRQKVTVKQNGQTGATLTNRNGTVRAVLAASTGDQMRCQSKPYGQRSTTAPVPALTPH